MDLNKAPFTLKDNAWYITEKQKPEFIKYLRDEITKQNLFTDTGKLSLGEFPSTVFVGDEQNRIRNRAGKGDKSAKKFSFAKQKTKQIEQDTRKLNKTYSGPGGQQASRDAYKLFDKQKAEAEMLGMGKHYVEHRTPLDAYEKFGSALYGSDDPQNLILRPDDNIKGAKDTVEKLSKSRGYTWATDITDDDFLQVVNATEWDPDNHRGKGILMSADDVDNFKRFLSNKPVLDASPEFQNKVDYLMKETKVHVTDLNGTRTVRYNAYKTFNNRNNNGIGNGLNGRNGRKGLSNKFKIGTGGVALASLNFLPSEAGAKEVQELVDDKKYTEACVTLGTDLVVGDVTGRAMLKATTKVGNILAKKGVKKIVTRKLIMLAGRQLAKKGLALAAGPAAPAILTALILKDVYDIANVVSRGRLNESVGDAFSSVKTSLNGARTNIANAF